jgi:hypothetical protein
MNISTSRKGHARGIRRCSVTRAKARCSRHMLYSKAMTYHELVPVYTIPSKMQTWTLDAVFTRDEDTCSNSLLRPDTSVLYCNCRCAVFSALSSSASNRLGQSLIPSSHPSCASTSLPLQSTHSHTNTNTTFLHCPILDTHRIALHSRFLSPNTHCKARDSEAALVYLTVSIHPHFKLTGAHLRQALDRLDGLDHQTRRNNNTHHTHPPPLTPPPPLTLALL